MSDNCDNCNNLTSSELANHNPQDVPQDVQNEPAQPVSYGPYWEMFKTMKIRLSGNRELPLEDLWVSSCTLVDVSLAILSEVEMLEHSNLARDKELLQGYKSLKVKFTESNKKTKTYNISLSGMAKSILDIAEKYKEHDFVHSTICQNWEWSSRLSKEEKEKKKYDPYNFSNLEKEARLKDAGMTLFAKTFRLYLIESVRRCFPRTRNCEDWDSANAFYKVGNKERTSQEFVKFMDELFEVFDQIIKLSDDLDEYKNLVKNAVLVGRKEKFEKRETYKVQKRLEQNYKKVSSMTSTTSFNTEDLSYSLVTSKSQGVTDATSVDSSTATQTEQETTQHLTTPNVALQNMWKTSEKSLVHKLVDNGIVPESHFQKPSENKENETTHTDEKHKNNTSEKTQKYQKNTNRKNFTYRAPEKPLPQKVVVKRKSHQESVDKPTTTQETLTTDHETENQNKTNAPKQRVKTHKNVKQSNQTDGQQNDEGWTTVKNGSSKNNNNNKKNVKQQNFQKK